jgi:hypothetical protein
MQAVSGSEPRQNGCRRLVPGQVFPLGLAFFLSNTELQVREVRAHDGNQRTGVSESGGIELMQSSARLVLRQFG